MAIKSVSIRIEKERLNTLGFVADYEGRSINSHILVLILESDWGGTRRSLLT